MAIYYVSTAGNNANNGTSTATPWLTVAKVNSSVFVAGDQVLFNRGNVWAEQLIVPASGAVGNPIVFGAYGSGALPRFNPSVTPLSISGKNNVTVQDLDLYNSSANASTMAVTLGGTCANLTLQRLSLSSVGYGMWTGAVLTGLVIDAWTIDTARQVLQGIELTATGTINPIIRNCTMKRGIYLNNCAGATLANNTSTASQGRGLRVNTCSGAIIVDKLTVTSPSSYGVEIINSTLTGAVIRNVKVTGGTVNAIRVSNSSGVAFARCSVEGNGSTGGYMVETASTNVSFTDCTVMSGGAWAFRATGASNLSYTRCLAASAAGSGFTLDGACSNVTHYECIAQTCGYSGFNVMGTSAAVTYQGCEARGNGIDGFLASGAAYNVTWYGCRATGNGTKYSTSDGDGFTAHDTNYNIKAHYCIADNNTGSGFAMVGTSAGEIFNCVAYNNGGDWLAAGTGVNQIRAGIYMSVSGVNATSGGSWTVKNTIGKGNYPREIYLGAAAAAIVAMDYNRYQESNAAKFATLDGAATDITWATYAAREPNSANGDPLMTDPANGDFSPQAASPAINTGASLGLMADYAGARVPQRGRPDIGANEYLAVFRTPRIGSSRIRFRSAA